MHEMKHNGYRLMARRDAVGIPGAASTGPDGFRLMVEARTRGGLDQQAKQIAHAPQLAMGGRSRCREKLLGAEMSAAARMTTRITVSVVLR
jgi:hypothetical protein